MYVSIQCNVSKIISVAIDINYLSERQTIDNMRSKISDTVEPLVLILADH